MMNLSPKDMAKLPPWLRAEMRRKLLDLLRDLGVTPMMTPDGEVAADLAQLAPALGMTIEQAQAPDDAAGHA